MKLTINLYDPAERMDALNILSLFDQEEVPEEVVAEPVVAEPVVADPVDLGIDKPAETPAAVPKVSLDPTAPAAEKAGDVTAKDVQDLAMELNKGGQIDRAGLVTRLASYGGAVKISGLDQAGLNAFHAELLSLKGEVNV